MVDIDFNVNTGETADTNKADYIKKNKENREYCNEMLVCGTEMVSEDGVQFQNYLDMQAKFLHYSATNGLLIMMQNEEAQKIGDYGYWRNQGLYLCKGEYEKPLLIFEPGKNYEGENGRKGTFYNTKKMYDISQVNIKEFTQQAVHFDEKLLIRALIHNPPVSIQGVEETPQNMVVEFDQSKKCIFVRKGSDAVDIIKGLTQEMAFAEFSLTDKDFTFDKYQIHSYAASYLLCKKYGIDTAEFSFEQAPEYFKKMESKEVRSELSKMQNVANKISSRMNEELGKGKQKNGYGGNRSAGHRGRSEAAHTKGSRNYEAR